MSETLLEDRPALNSDPAGVQPAGLPRAAPGRPAAVTHDDLARFIRDPMAFASRAGAPEPRAFVKAYLEGLEQRLSGTVGAPRATSHRLATLSPDTLEKPLVGLSPSDGATGIVGDRADGLDLSPRMGPVLVAAAVVTAVTSVVQAATAVTLMMAKHKAA